MERAELQPILRPPGTPREPMEFLSRSWSSSAFETSKAFRRNGIFGVGSETIHEDDPSPANSVSGNPFSFACSETSQLVMERIMSQAQSEFSPLTSGRPSHSSGPLNAGLSCGSLTDSPPISPSQVDDLKYFRLNTYVSSNHKSSATTRKTVGRWMKDRREKKKEEARTHNAQLHAAISVAGVASAIAAISAATTEVAVASAATLVAAHCVEAAEAMGADRDHLASVVSSAVNVQSAGDIITLTAAAATALRGAAALKARTMKDVLSIAAVIPMDKGIGITNGSSNGSSNASFSGELVPDEILICSLELLARGTKLLKKTRKGELHWKVVSVYINRLSQVILKMKSCHVAGKKKKNVVLEVMSDIPAWTGRDLVEGGEHKRYFALKTISRGVVEFECRNQREYDIWTEGVSRLLAIAAGKNNRHRM